MRSSTTAVQLARLCSVIANGGMLVKPKLILRRGDKPEPNEEAVRVLKPETVMTMRMMMEGVVLNPRGTAHLTARLDGYTSAGKTGTAQIFDNKTHRYTHLYNASFMGFTPVMNPKLVILVTINGTAGDGGMGAAAAAPVFKTIATEALRMLDVPKDIPEDLVADAKNQKAVKPVADDLSIPDLGSPSIMDEDFSVQQLLASQNKPNSEPNDEDEIPPAPVVAGPKVPDFRGKSMRAVVEQASADGIEVMVEGSGVARASSLCPENLSGAGKESGSCLRAEMILSELLAGVPLLSDLSPELARVEVKGLDYDSRRIENGFVFFAFPGARVDGRSLRNRL